MIIIKYLLLFYFNSVELNYEFHMMGLLMLPS